MGFVLVRKKTFSKREHKSQLKTAQLEVIGSTGVNGSFLRVGEFAVTCVLELFTIGRRMAYCRSVRHLNTCHTEIG